MISCSVILGQTHPESLEPFLNGGLIVARVLFQVLQIDFGNFLLAPETAHDAIV